MAIELQHVTKRYGALTALTDASVSFGDNKIYGLLGNNGAGKSTMLNLITGRIFPDEGAILVDGKPANRDDSLGKIFLMGETNLFPDEMRVHQAIRWSGEFYPGFDRAYAEQLAQRFGLPLKKKIKSLSTGYASICRIVLALSSRAPYLLLDEPVLGLDAQHREMFYRLLIEHYAAQPCTIVISTHLIAEVANLIEHTVILRAGTVIVDQPREALPDKASRQPLSETLTQSGADLQSYFIKLMEEGARHD